MLTKPLHIDFDSITQGQLEAYFKVFRELSGDESKVGVIEYAGSILRAAVQVGWLQLDVDNAPPRQVQEISRSIQKFITSVLEFDAKN